MTIHDEDVDPVSRGYTYGTAAGARYGTDDGGSYGPQRPDAYRARIITDDDQRFDLDAVITADIQLEHTGVSDVRLEVPRIQGLKRFRFGTMDVFFGDRFVFRATLERFPGPGTSETGEVYGRGPARALQRQTLSVNYSGQEAWRAIRQTWDAVGFEATVIEPSTTTTLSDYSKEGTALEVLQDLHERAGMRFTILHNEPGQVVESYDPSELTKSGSWDAISHRSEGDVTEYANEVRVFGGKADDGTRVSATARDQSEIDTNGKEPIRIDDPAITSNADAQSRADEELAERLGNDTFSGQLEVVPQMILPGYYRSIPEWDTGSGAPVLSVDSVSLSESVGGGSATVKVNAPDGVADVVAGQQRQIAELQQPDDVASGSGTDPDPSPTVISSWESGDLSSWPVYNSTFNVITGDSANAFDGDSYLEQPTSSNQAYIASAPGDGLGQYFPKGTEARVLFWSEDTDGNERRALFGVPDPADEDNCYVAELYDATNGDRELRLRKRSGGSESTLATATASTSDLADQTWYEFRITWDDGSLGGADNDITIELVQDPAGSATSLATVGPISDSAYGGNEGVGVWANNAEAVVTRFDYYHIPA